MTQLVSVFTQESDHSLPASHTTAACIIYNCRTDNGAKPKVSESPRTLPRAWRSVGGGRGVLALSLQDPGPDFPPEPGQPDPLSFWRSLKYFAIGYDVSHFLAQTRVSGLTGSCEI